jgi:hypothetical protein
MKTAMQELKESLQSINERYELKGDANWLMNEVLDLVDNSLEKEKEQIIYDYNNGVNDGNTQGLQGKEGNGNYTTLEEYYNQTYNQNK